MTRTATRGRILVVDDKLEMAETLADGLVDAGFDAIAIGSSRKAAAALRSGEIDVLVTDLRMPEIDGLELLSRSMSSDPARPVIVMTAYGAIDTAIEAIRRGAFHYLTKPFKLEELALFVRRALEKVALVRETEALRRSLRQQTALVQLVGESDAMAEVVETARRIAGVDAPVLILGETGTGKGLIARAIHDAGPRASAPFVTVNCAAIPESLLESELFGHVRGAFTGASEPRAGLFAEAHGGTIFLDEVGDMPLPLQAKLLDVLERRVVRAVGAAQERAIDVRVLSASHRNLHARAEAGTFRADLLYRLDVVPIELPALRHRAGDIPLLVDHFFRSARDKHPQASAQRISADALRALVTYRWPGNVRELAHVVERVVLLARGEEVLATDLPAAVRASRAVELEADFGEIVSMREMQRRYARFVVERNDGRRTRAAEQLDIDPKTLARLLDETEPRGDGTR